MQSSSTAVRGSVDSPQWAKERLDSWKEVASFFRREVRTVQLWEKSEGLPVRRQHHKKLGSVYAYRQELESWWAARSAIRPGSTGTLEFPADRKRMADLPTAIPDGCRMITIPFEA